MSEDMAGSRQRWLRIGLVGGAVLVVAVAVIIAVIVAGGEDASDDQQTYEKFGAWADGDEVHVGAHTVTVPGAADIRYTSQGAVVAGTDGYQLVTPAGDVEPLDLDVETGVDLNTGGVLYAPIAAGASEPYIGYLELVDEETVQLVVHDLRTGEEQTVGEPGPRGEVTIPEGSWLWEDQLYYHDERDPEEDGPGTTVDWRTGETQPDVGPTAGSGVVLSADESGSWIVRDHDGDDLLTIRMPDPFFSWASLSPDGRYVAVTDSAAETTVYDVAGGDGMVVESQPVRDAGVLGWSPDGHLIGQSRASEDLEIELCDPATGKCDGTGTTIAGTPVPGHLVTVVAGASDEWP